MNQGYVIAIDGPVASGKDTISNLLAKKYEGIHINSGSFFRCVALYCLNNSIDLMDQEGVIDALPEMDIALSPVILLGGVDVSEAIKAQKVSEGSSKVALIPEVQEKMINIHRDIANRLTQNGKMVIIDGRNVGTAIFPDAQIKIMLTASVEQRARRRYSQMGGEAVLEEVVRETEKRDERDMNRPTHPLVSNPEGQGYVVLNNSTQSPSESLSAIEEILRNKALL